MIIMLKNERPVCNQYISTPKTREWAIDVISKLRLTEWKLQLADCAQSIYSSTTNRPILTKRV